MDGGGREHSHDEPNREQSHDPHPPSHPPPAHRGHAVRFYFAQQPQAQPPTIIVSTNYPLGVPESYKRYVVGKLRERFGFEGAPVRVFFRARKGKGEASKASKSKGKASKKTSKTSKGKATKGGRKKRSR